MENLMERFFRPEEGWFPAVTEFAPKADLAETDAAYELTVDLPGIKPEDVNVEIRDGGLWISGTRKEEKEEKGKTFHRLERSYGEFRRLIPLAGGVDADKVEAEYKDGVLKVTVPKTEAAKPKHITVKT
jgi:HSP20 family protein